MRDQERKSPTFSLNKEKQGKKKNPTKNQQQQLISKKIDSGELWHSLLFSYLRIYSLENILTQTGAMGTAVLTV